MIAAPAARRRRDTSSATPPCCGELEGVRQQVLQHLLQALGVGDDAAAEVRVDARRRTTAAGSRPRAGTAAPIALEQVGEEDLLRIDRHRAGFDLRQIEDVADQVEQVGAGAVDGARELDLLGRSGCRPGCRRAAGRGSGCEFSGVRSSCDMLARNSDLYFEVSASSVGLFFQRAPRLLDFLVLALHFDVPLGELLRLLLELFVGLLQLASAASAARRRAAATA